MMNNYLKVVERDGVGAAVHKIFCFDDHDRTGYLRTVRMAEEMQKAHPASKIVLYRLPEREEAHTELFQCVMPCPTSGREHDFKELTTGALQCVRCHSTP